MKCFTKDRVLSKNKNIAIGFHNACNEEIHIHDFLEFVYISDGEGYQYIDEKKYSVSHGDMMFINYNHTHAFSSDTGMKYYNIYLVPEFISKELINSNNAMQMLSLTAFEDFRETVGFEKPFIHFDKEESSEIENCLNAMMREYDSCEGGYLTVLKSYMSVILTYIFRKMSVFSEDTDSNNKDRRIEMLTEYIEKNCTDTLTLDKLAEKCFYNPSYFSRAFKEYRGMTITDFIHKNRIKKACEMLLHTDKSIDIICSETGYSNKNVFYKKFLKFTGIMPAEYRKKGI